MLFSISATSVERRFCPHAEPQAFAGVQVDNRQQAQSSPVKQRIRDKIHAPDVIRIQTLRLRLSALCGRLRRSDSPCSL